jgi:DNA-binding NarL/FixJ family response regulator
MLAMSQPQPVSPPAVIALVTDLIFSSRISGAAKAVGSSVKILRKPDQLAESEGSLLLADLNLDGAAAAAAQWAATPGRRVVGFVSHMDAAAIAAARDLGIHEILPRSRFIQVLPDLLRPW